MTKAISEIWRSVLMHKFESPTRCTLAPLCQLNAEYMAEIHYSRYFSRFGTAAAAKYEAAMTFEEIGARLGISKKLAYFHFVSGLKKIRRNPAALRQLSELVEMRASLRGEIVFPDWNV